MQYCYWHPVQNQTSVTVQQRQQILLLKQLTAHKLQSTPKKQIKPICYLVLNEYYAPLLLFWYVHLAQLMGLPGRVCCLKPCCTVVRQHTFTSTPDMDSLSRAHTGWAGPNESEQKEKNIRRGFPHEHGIVLRTGNRQSHVQHSFNFYEWIH